MLSLTRIFTFDMAHALLYHQGKCRHIHGHTYRLEVSVAGEVVQERHNPLDGMIMDFAEMKTWIQSQVLDHYDHALVLDQEHPVAQSGLPGNEYEKIVLMPCSPTCENILLDIYRRLSSSLVPGVRISRIRLSETPGSFAEWSED